MWSNIEEQEKELEKDFYRIHRNSLRDILVSCTDRSRNQAYEMLEYEYSETVPASNFLTCQTSGTKCFSIKMSQTKFYYFGQLKAPISSPILVDD
jgi:hypothetical protein